MAQQIPAETSHKLANMGLICACLVVFIHVASSAAQGSLVWWVRHFLSEGVCRIAVPFFFAASGYLLAGHMDEVGWWYREIRKRTKTIVVPYFMWTTLFCGYSFCVTVLANVLAHEEIFRNISAAWVLKSFGLGIGVNLAALWFLRNVLFLVLLSPILKLLERRLGYWVLLVFFALYGLFCPWEKCAATFWVAVWTYLFSLEGLFYFSLGMFLRRRTRLPCLTRGAAISLFLVACALFITTAWAEIVGASWYYYPRWIGIPLALWSVWSLMPARPWNKTLTTLSFPIYLMHTFFVSSVGLIVKQCCPWVTSSLLYYAGVAVVAVACSACIALLLRRISPRLASLLFGGR